MEIQIPMQRKVEVAGFAALLFFSLSAFGGESSEALAERFVKLLRYDRQLETMNERCARDQSAISPDALVARNPNYFDGLTPKSAQWPAVVAAFAEYRQQACSRPTKAEVLQALSSSYAKAMTARQLQESIEFYSSATGQALVEANQRATFAAEEAITVARSKVAVELTTQLQNRIRALLSDK